MQSETKTHSTSSVQACQNCKNDFTIEPDDFVFYEKMKVPAPTFCPECRIIRRMTWRNERTLYHRKCDATGKNIITMFAPEQPVVVYERDYWWSDSWDQLASGQDYDFSKPFFQQFRELFEKAPLSNLANTNIVNSDYSNHSLNLKNCYLFYASARCEDISYCAGALDSKNSLDLYKTLNLIQCYDDTLCGDLNRVFFSYDSDESVNCAFLHACKNLIDCLGCINLRNKSNCIFNQQYTKEEYEVLIPKIIEHMNQMPYKDSLGREWHYGSTFPLDIHAFAYNETIAQELFPITKEEAQRQGYRWVDTVTKNHNITLKGEDVPDSIREVDEQILKEIIGCVHAGKCNHMCTEAFKVTSSDLIFYKRLGIPIPQVCPNCRHFARLSQCTPIKLYDRNCAKCSNAIKTSYALDRPEVVYCKQCYNNEVA